MKIFLLLAAALFPVVTFAEELRVTRVAEVRDANRPSTLSMVVSKGGVTFSRQASIEPGAVPRPGGSFICSVEHGSVNNFAAILTKYREWNKIAFEHDVLDFTKPIGNLQGQEVRFIWSQREKTALLSGFEGINMADIPALLELTKQYADARAGLDALLNRQAEEAKLFK